MNGDVVHRRKLIEHLDFDGPRLRNECAQTGAEVGRHHAAIWGAVDEQAQQQRLSAVVALFFVKVRIPAVFGAELAGIEDAVGRMGGLGHGSALQLVQAFEDHAQPVAREVADDDLRHVRFSGGGSLSGQREEFPEVMASSAPWRL
jgi:hypothetical protein